MSDRTISEYVLVNTGDGRPLAIADGIKKAMEEIPEEHRDSARVHSYEEVDDYLEIRWERPETPEEARVRIWAEEQAALEKARALDSARAGRVHDEVVAAFEGLWRDAVAKWPEMKRGQGGTLNASIPMRDGRTCALSVRFEGAGSDGVEG